MRDESAKKQDAEFWTRFGLVLGSLVAFTFACAFIARAISPSSTDLKEATNSSEAISARIAPAGRLHVAGAELPEDALLAQAPAAPAAPAAVAVSAPAATASSGESRDGQTVYAEACQLCHGVGLAGAPKPGDAAAWKPRVDQGMDTLYHNSINGIRGMPARGGRLDLSDAEVRAAVDYMLSM